MVAVAHVHVFDQPHDHGRAAEPLEQRGYRVVVDAPLHHRIDFDRREPCLECSRNAVQHLPDAAEAAAHPVEDRVVQRIEAYRDPPEPVSLEPGGMLCEQDAVGREREVVDAVDGGQFAHEVRQPAAQQRLAARQPQLRHAERGGVSRDTANLPNDNRSADFRNSYRSWKVSRGMQ